MSVGLYMRIAVIAACAGALLLPAHASAVLVYQRGPSDDFNAPIVVAHNDGSGARVVAHGFAPQVSPTGRRVAYFVGTDTLYKVAVDGTHRRKLSSRVTRQEPPGGIAWSPDDRYIVTASDNFGTRLIDLLKQNSSTRNIGIFGGASFAPDGERFAIQAVGSSDSGIFIGSVRKRQLRDSHSGFRPAWGPPGLAFGREHKILLRRRIGERAETLLSEPFPAVGPIDWSANGHRLLIYEEPSRRPWRAAIIHLPSKTVTRIPVPVSAVYAISNDGHDVLAEQDGDVVVLRLDGTKRIVAHNATNASWTK